MTIQLLLGKDLVEMEELSVLFMPISDAGV